MILTELPHKGCPWNQDCVMEELKTLRAVQQNVRSKCAEEISLHMAPGIGTANPGKTHIIYIHLPKKKMERE